MKNALDSYPDDVRLLGALAAAQVALARLDEAIQTCETALEIDPSCTQALALEIAVFQRLGQFEDAIQSCRKLLTIDPTSYQPRVEIVRSKRIDPTDAALVEELERLVSDPNLDTPVLFHVHRALGKAFDDLGRFGVAAEHFEKSNEIARRLAPMPYNFREREKDLQTIKSLFPAETLRRTTPTLQPTPILIVGMVRSGTTLLDSMLSRLENIGSAGEVRFWNLESGRYLRNPSLLQSPTELSELGKRYLAELSAVSPETSHIVDKMPLNFRHLGLIRLAAPKAKIIHLRRHPADTAISIYTSEFGPQAPSFVFDKKRIVHFYRLYLEMMEHWRRALPEGSFIEVDYERIVADPITVLGRVFEFLEIPWSDNVLDRSLIQRDLNTPSRWQARQPLYTSSVERWRNYYSWLDELSDLLSPEEIKSMTSEIGPASEYTGGSSICPPPRSAESN